MAAVKHNRKGILGNLRLLVVSMLAFCVTVACAWIRRGDRDGDGWFGATKTPRADETPEVLCYEAIEVDIELTPTATPMLLCYTAAAEPQVTYTPTITPTTATPTPTFTPLPPQGQLSPEQPEVPVASLAPLSREVLLQRLLKDGRFPDVVASVLHD